MTEYVSVDIDEITKSPRAIWKAQFVSLRLGMNAWGREELRIHQRLLRTGAFLLCVSIIGIFPIGVGKYTPTSLCV